MIYRNYKHLLENIDNSQNTYGIEPYVFNGVLKFVDKSRGTNTPLSMDTPKNRLITYGKFASGNGGILRLEKVMPDTEAFSSDLGLAKNIIHNIICDFIKFRIENINSLYEDYDEAVAALNKYVPEEMDICVDRFKALFDKIDYSELYAYIEPGIKECLDKNWTDDDDDDESDDEPEEFPEGYDIDEALVNGTATVAAVREFSRTISSDNIPKALGIVAKEVIEDGEYDLISELIDNIEEINTDIVDAFGVFGMDLPPYIITELMVKASTYDEYELIDNTKQFVKIVGPDRKTKRTTDEDYKAARDEKRKELKENGDWPGL